jgi:DNA invertase Pin-like site-specific DNA recombinase
MSKPKKIDTLLYIRVSTDEQNTARQEKELKAWALRTGSKNTKTIIEKISGSVPAAERKLNRAFSMDGLKRVVVQDVDRLGRDTIDILQTIKKFTQKGINLTVTALSSDTLTPTGAENPAFKLILSVMATIAEMERTKIKERQRQGIEIRKLQGGYKGRKIGTVDSPQKIINKHQKVVKEIKAGLSVRKVAKLCDVSPNTVQRVKRALKEQEQELIAAKKILFTGVSAAGAAIN